MLSGKRERFVIKQKKKNGGRIRLPSDLRKLAQGGWDDLTKTRVSFAMGLAFSC